MGRSKESVFYKPSPRLPNLFQSCMSVFFFAIFTFLVHFFFFLFRMQYQLALQTIFVTL